MRLGIDFGTTRTVVAAAMHGRYPVASFETPQGFAEYVPGVAARVAGDNAGAELVYGWDAHEQLQAGNGVALRSIKRLLATSAPDDAITELGSANGAGAPSAIELLSGFLAALRRSLTGASNLDIAPDEPLEAMVAVPAHASTHQRYLTLEAFRRAGFSVLGLVNEPTAAAIEFAYRHLSALSRRSPKRYVVVYDLGGGTFDSSAVSLENREFSLLASEGIARCGGDDFDELILGLALEALNVSERSLSPGTRTAALEACRIAKESVAPASRKLHLELGELGAVALDLATVTAGVEPLVDRTLERLERVLDALPAHGIDPTNPRELGALYLVGGACAFAPVTRLLRARFKHKLQLAVQPHAATAVGLAIAADPDAAVQVREAVTRHFGVWREADAGRRKTFDCIFSKDTASASAARRYRPAHAVGHLRFVECTELSAEGEPAGDLTPCGELLFPYDPALAEHGSWSEADAARPIERAADVVECYSYDASGIVRVTIESPFHKQSAELGLRG
jgi:molecular chaperone DnaK (HSP70)